MGWLWCGDDPECVEHEGFVVGLVRDEWRWRELGFDDLPVRDLRHVQVGCECGWRSPRMVAPLGTEWVPCMVEFSDEGYREQARELWLAHIERELHRPEFGPLALPEVSAPSPDSGELAASVEWNGLVR